MEQITMKVDDAFFEKIKIRMEKKGCKTLAQCTRELTELGMRVEEAADSQEEKNDENDTTLALINLLKTNLTWSLETRFLMRFLLENWNNIESVQPNDFMEKAKQRATVVIDDLMKDKKND